MSLKNHSCQTNALVLLRLNELTARPAAVEQARRYLDELREVYIATDSLQQFYDESHPPPNPPPQKNNQKKRVKLACGFYFYFLRLFVVQYSSTTKAAE